MQKLECSGAGKVGRSSVARAELRKEMSKR